MGSLGSRPSIPAAPTPAPTSVQTVTTQAPVVTTTASQSTNTPSEAEREQAQSEARSNSLLNRSRGRFGTIRTGFRGLLDLAPAQAAGRKTLLGE